jgi:hypothetical protein
MRLLRESFGFFNATNGLLLSIALLGVGLAGTAAAGDDPLPPPAFPFPPLEGVPLLVGLDGGGVRELAGRQSVWTEQLEQSNVRVPTMLPVAVPVNCPEAPMRTLLKLIQSKFCPQA